MQWQDKLNLQNIVKMATAPGSIDKKGYLSVKTALLHIDYMCRVFTVANASKKGREMKKGKINEILL